MSRERLLISEDDVPMRLCALALAGQDNIARARRGEPVVGLIGGATA